MDGNKASYPELPSNVRSLVPNYPYFHREKSALDDWQFSDNVLFARQPQNSDPQRLLSHEAPDTRIVDCVDLEDSGENEGTLGALPLSRASVSDITIQDVDYIVEGGVSGDEEDSETDDKVNDSGSPLVNRHRTLLGRQTPVNPPQDAHVTTGILALQNHAVSDFDPRVIGEGRREASFGRRRGGRGRGRGRYLGSGPESQSSIARNQDGFRGRPRGSRSKFERSRGRQSGLPRKSLVAEPSDEFKELQGKAMSAFLEKDFDTAIRHASDAVHLNPEIFAAHSLLSEIYNEIGRVDDSLQVLFIGAHTSRDPNVWWEVARRTDALPINNENNRAEKMLICYQNIIKLDKKDFEARRERLRLNMRMPFSGKATNECIQMLRIRPLDLDTLRTFAGLAVDGRQIHQAHQAKAAYVRAVDKLRKIYPDGLNCPFDFSDLNFYAELLLMLKQWEIGLRTISELGRWLCGRSAESCWNLQQDSDCEWDLSNQPRRVQAIGYDPSLYPQKMYGDSLPMELRVKMGICRLGLGPEHFPEAMRHFEFLRPTDRNSEAPVYDYPDLFTEVGDMLFFSFKFASALRFYEPLVKTKSAVESIVRARMARAYQEINRIDDAIGCFEVLEKSHPRNVHFLTELGKLYSAKGDLTRAETYTNLAIKLRRMEVVKGDKELDPEEYDRIMKAGMQRAQSQYQRDENNVAIEKYTEHTEVQDFEIVIGRFDIVPTLNCVFGEERCWVPPGLKKTEEICEEIEEFKTGVLRRLAAPRASRPTPVLNYRARPGRILVPNPNSDDTLNLLKLTRPLEPLTAPKQARVVNYSRPQPRTTIEPLKSLEPTDQEWTVHLRRIRMQILQPSAFAGVEAAAREWMDHGQKIITEFSATTTLFDGHWKPGATTQNNTLRFPDLTHSVARDENGDLIVTHENPEARSLGEKPVPEDFRGILMSDWLDTFCRYAFIAAKHHQKTRSYTALQVASKAHPFSRNEAYIFHIYVSWMACALMLNDEYTVSQTARWLVKLRPDATDNLQLFAAIKLLLRHKETTAYTNAANIRILLRHMKLMGIAFPDPAATKGFGDHSNEPISFEEPAKSRDASPALSLCDSNMHGLASLQPTLMVTYGHIMCNSDSHTSALYYYLRANALSPSNAMIALSISLSHLHLALRRKCDRRQYNITQGITFFRKYCRSRVRTTKAEGKQIAGQLLMLRREEVEYNEGRMWQMLGLWQQAMSAYERCLAVNEDSPVLDWEGDRSMIDISASHASMKNPGSDDMDLGAIGDVNKDVTTGMTASGHDLQEDYKREAAFAFQQIYTMAADMANAQELTRTWLVF